MKDKLIRASVYEAHEPQKNKFKKGRILNFYLSDIGAVMDAGIDTDCVINLSGQLFIIDYPYETLLAEWTNYRIA